MEVSKYWGLPWWLSGKEDTCQYRRHEFDPGSGRSLEKEMVTHSSILPGKSYGQRSLVGYSPWGQKRVEHDLATKE